ncbi:MAG: 16S rRNA (cytidine(1402)-2'-O)-methyltransferase [bacterium]
MSNQKTYSGTLYVVATPIGNLEDLSPRAVRILNEVDLIACEDTRHTRKLLDHFSIRTSTTSYHEHNEGSKAPVLMKQLQKGENLALVSDAGTPLLSDPGYRLVRSCRQAGIEALPIPGPFAGAAACSVAGLPTDEILFAGFLPDRVTAQRKELKHLSAERATLVIYLSPHGLKKTLKRISEILGDREACLVRELTKIHETGRWGLLESIVEEIAEEKPRGEYTLVVRGRDTSLSPGSRSENFDIDAYVHGLIHRRGLSKKEAIKLAAIQLRLPKREVYKVLVRDTQQEP